ncbi:MAG: ATP-binding protein [Desulfarculus sp.]|nr:ATP-binding protein [Desulfarculus sp.]
MINKRLEDIRKEDIEALITEQVRESRHIEYKESLPGNSDSEKKEFLADVSAFANASGGMIIYGIREKREEGQPTSLPEQIVGLSDINVDKEKQRLLAIVGSGVEPRMPNIQIEAVPDFDEYPVIILKIPKSWCGPHMIKYQQWSRFYLRTSAGKQQLDVGEIRNAFFMSENLANNIRRFREERIAKILSNDGPSTINNNSKLVVHIVPINAFNTPIVNDFTSQKGIQTGLYPLSGGGYSMSYNFDGLILANSYGYLQVFRNGTLEAADSYYSLENSGGEGNSKCISTTLLENELIRGMHNYLQVLNQYQVTAPIYVLISMLNVRGFRLATRDHYWSRHRNIIDRDHLIFPEILIEEYGADCSVIFRSFFDILWQSCGFERCFSYDKNGARHS